MAKTGLSPFGRDRDDPAGHYRYQSFSPADRRHRAAHRRALRRDTAPGAPGTPQSLTAGRLVQGDQVATHRNLQDRTGEQLGEAVEIARHLPPRLLVHLNSERLVEVALGSCVTTGLNSEVFLAAAGVVLSWAHDLSLPLAPLLAAYGTKVGYALAEVRSTLELLGGLDPTA